MAGIASRNRRCTGIMALNKNNKLKMASDISENPYGLSYDNLWVDGWVDG